MPDRSYTLVRRLNRWLQQASSTHDAQCKALPVRRDVVTVLTYVRDHKVVGTQSTGNFPLKVVREVTARFVDPPVLDTTIGDRTYRLRSEDDIWPLVLVHSLAYAGGLLALGRGRRWRVTLAGEQFLKASPLFQVWALLATWWYEADWVIAYPFVGMAKGLPRDFKQMTLNHLLSLPVDARISSGRFADDLIQKTGLQWTSEDPTSHRILLHGAVNRMVIGILTDFDTLEPEYQDKPMGKGTIPELVAFQITPFGRALLESLAT